MVWPDRDEQLTQVEHDTPRSLASRTPPLGLGKLAADLPRIEIGHGGIGLAQRHACSLRLPAGPVPHPASCRGAAPSGLR